MSDNTAFILLIAMCMIFALVFKIIEKGLI